MGLMKVFLFLTFFAQTSFSPRPQTNDEVISEWLDEWMFKYMRNTTALEKATPQQKSIWNDFKTTFSKTYPTIEEENKRFQIFISNDDMIVRHNGEYTLGRQPYKLKMNEYGDLTHEEFAAMMNGLDATVEDATYQQQYDFPLEQNAVRSAPDTVDWRLSNAVTPVKRQGNCSSCWAFSTAGALESQIFITYGVLESLSTQELVDCANRNPVNSNKCPNGTLTPAYRWVSDHNGLQSDVLYPYEAKVNICRRGEALRYWNPQLQRYDLIISRNLRRIRMRDEADLRDAVAMGPVSVSINAAHLDLQFAPADDVFDNATCVGPLYKDLNHAMVAVGYGTAADGKAYWLVKNSVGSTWGDNGYIKMARNKGNQCGIATLAMAPIVTAARVQV